MSSNGTVLHSEIVGVVKMKSYLSGSCSPLLLNLGFFFFSSCGQFLTSNVVGQTKGMPELKLGLNDKLMFEATGRSSG